jgi:hypothetical protein
MDYRGLRIAKENPVNPCLPRRLVPTYFPATAEAFCAKAGGEIPVNVNGSVPSFVVFSIASDGGLSVKTIDIRWSVMWTDCVNSFDRPVCFTINDCTILGPSHDPLTAIRAALLSRDAEVMSLRRLRNRHDCAHEAVIFAAGTGTEIKHGQRIIAVEIAIAIAIAGGGREVQRPQSL